MIETLLQKWRGLARRERRMVAGGLTVIVLALIYLLLVEPATVGRSEISAELPGLRAQVSRMELLSGEVRRLASAPVVADSSSQLRERIEQSAVSAGLGAMAQVGLVGERIEVKAKGVPFATLVDWLDSVLRETRVRVVDANVARDLQPGLVTAKVVLEAPRQEKH